MIIGNKPSNKDIEKLASFKKLYYDYFPDYLQEELETKLYNGYTNNNDFINQIYCYLNIEPTEINAYKEFYNILKSNFDIEKSNILEVGSGTIPILSNYIDNMSLIDKKIIPYFYLGKNYQEKEFNEKTNIDNYNLIIGYNPCQATESIIKNSIKNNKDFCIALCGCCFLPNNYNDRTTEKWHEYLFNLAYTLGNGKYNITKLFFDNKYKIEYPIIIGKYNK